MYLISTIGFIFINSFFFYLVVPFNQPQLCSTANWNSHGITFANQSIVGEYPQGIFITTNNTIYVPNKNTNEILVWYDGNINPTKITSGNFISPSSLFVTMNGDIYIDDGWKNGRVQKWISNNSTWIILMNVKSTCRGLFIDINENLYCSMGDHHQVMKSKLSDSTMSSIVVAGTGIAGSASNELNRPLGIFVDVNLDLYVAECDNHRVQLFQSGQLNGITVVGHTSKNPTISLSCPSGIVLNANKYLFIVDMINHRIIGSNQHGFRCLVGCHGRGYRSDQLNTPYALSFDHFGNLYVTDQNNHRIQKFEFLENSCGKLKTVECDGKCRIILCVV